MDSYNLFGDDGSGMLEGLTDLGGSDNFTGGSTTGVAVDGKDAGDNSYRQQYSQSNVPQEGTIQKMAAFGGGGSSAIGSNTSSAPVPGTGPPGPEYHEYGPYPPRPRLPQPPHNPLHPSHHVHASHSYPGYHPGPDPGLYSMPEHTGIGEMGVWSPDHSANRYAPMTPVYRHSYDHQPKLHQYPQQGGARALQTQNAPYLPRQPHFSQPSSQQVYGQQQNYPNYAQMHPPAASRINHHPAYHQQMDVAPHQYGMPHGQANHGPLQHQSLQNIPGHTGSLNPGIQGHSNVHLHHGGAPPIHHVPRQPLVPPSSSAQAHQVPPQMSYQSPHHSVSMNYPSHQVQHPLDVNVNQYNVPKPTGMETGSPQYRPPFPQLSPQMSPRAQMSPRQPQLSPRPVMSPVKGPCASPLGPRSIVPQSVISGQSQAGNNFSPHNTLQALEQMVLPAGSEYPFHRNPASPVIGLNIPASSQWHQNKLPTPLINLQTTDVIETQNKLIEPLPMQDLPKPEEPIISKKDILLEKTILEPESQVDATKSFLPTISNVPKNDILLNPPITCLPEVNHTSLDNRDNIELSLQEDAEKKLDDSSSNQEKVALDNFSNTLETIDSNKNGDNHEHISNIERNTNHSINIHESPTPVQGIFADNAISKEIQQHAEISSPISNTHNPYDTKTLGSRNQFGGSFHLTNVGSHSPIQTSTTQQTTTTNLNVPQSFQSIPPINTITSPQIPPSPQISNNSNLTSTIPSVNPILNQVNVNIPQTIQSLAGTPPHPNLSNTSGNISNVQINMPPMAIPNMHPAVGPNVPSQNLMPHHNLNPGMVMLGPNMPHPNMPAMFSTSHHQERMALQQQIQEIYCLPPSKENQEKVRFLQERLSLLQQHETNDKCIGGTNCILQNPVYGSKMVESPQVTSTTGRGRGKGPAKPRKPRVKKDKVSAIQTLDQLPVSEDCVTAGTGLQNSSEIDLDLTDDTINLDSSAISNEDLGVKTKKPRGPRKIKEKKPRVPKTPKEDKPVKERKKREPKDPNAPKKKRGPKKVVGEFQADTTTKSEKLPKEKLNTTNIDDSLNTSQILSMPVSLDDSNVTDFDDIPVSKIAVKELLEEADAKRELMSKDEDDDSICLKKKKKRNSIAINKRTPLKRTPSSGKRKKRSGVVLESDGEPDDMTGTPPPSPPTEDDSLKRRSARNTHRKKYTDDVMLRLSDDEYPVANTKQDKNIKSEDSINESKDLVKLDITPKPNYVYVNTTDEDSMIVQHILTSRMGVRHLKIEPEIIKEEIKEDVDSNVKAEISETALKSEILESPDIKTEDKLPIEAKDKLPIESEDKLPMESEDILTVESDDKLSIVSEDKLPIKPEDKLPVMSEDKLHVKPEDKLPLKCEEIDENKDHEVKSEKEDEPKDNILNKNISLDKDQEEKENKNAIVQSVDNQPTATPILVDVEEYFVKYRNFSYLHCEWKTEEELYKGDRRIYSKIKRFKQKQAQQTNMFELFDDEPFNPDYVEVERILDMSENQDPGSSTSVKHYLVKWKSLQYEDSTWELEEDVDVDKIQQYKIFNEIPSREKWKYKKRPSADHWSQLKETPVYKGGNTLRPYQLEGLNWLLFSWHNNRNCILADEMGLGKTIQSLTFVNAIWEYGIRGPFLIIAPLSTIPNWQREFEGWTDMNVVVYHGSQQSKSMIQEYEFYYKNQSKEPIKEITKFNVLITTFEIIVTDFQDLKLFNWRACVIDEAHRLKNRNCKLLEGLRQLPLEHRVLLSGTPLQNNVNELFSLLNFLEPSQFASSEAFLNEFGQLRSESEVLKLQALLKPMMLRRLKEDVEKSLAPKEETIIEVELTNIQKKYYRAILERNFSFLVKGTAAAANIPNLMNTMMELRKCCIHPYLLNGAEEQIQFDYKQVNGEDKEAYYKALIQSSGKMVLVDKLLPKLKSGGHRVLIFSQMVRCLDILEDYLIFKKYPYERIDGRIRGNLRQEAIDRFSKPDSDRFVFLLCTKAGGLGINLTAADTVIIYDSDWNPQNDLQAQARCHRIGQQKMVKIYRLVCRNSYEREMFDKASLKLGLDKAILQSMNTSQGKETGLKQLSKKEIEDLLKKGAYGAVMDEDNAGDKFCEEDIEIILARRTQVIQMESEKGSTFSKASFAATDQRSDIDIRDPDFWNKWAKKAEVDTSEKKEEVDLIVTEPRKRTSIKRYGHDDGNVEMSDMEATPDSDDDEEGGIGLRSKKKKDKLGKKGRKYANDDYIPRHEGISMDEEVVYGSWTRSECFKIERGLLTFGWGRWDDIVDKNQLRKGWTQPVIEDCARIIALYCLRHYKGDEKIRNFIWDLTEPCENGEVTISRNHSGLHNPVPRGRNAKKKNKPKDVPKLSDVPRWDDPNHWSSSEKYDCEAYLESSYKKHLFRHANKVLLRMRMMYYIKHEIIGDYSIQIEGGIHASAIGIRVPRGVDSAPPRMWWDTECDISLIVGTYVHGYENYLAMRSDPQLCFVDKLGPPDDAECTDIKSEVRGVAESGGGGDEEGTDDVSSGAGAASPLGSPRDGADAGEGSGGGGARWPSMQDLNTRLRRIITAYQRNYKREELKLQQRAKLERREQLARDELSQWRWARADEEAFRRTVASYGVEFDPATKSLRWARFRALARLDAKSDDALTDYLKAFMAMCKRQCGLSVGEAELPTRADLKAEPIGEERAIATLERIDLLRVLREEVAPAPGLEARLAGGDAARGGDAPPWWQPPHHDALLVRAVCRHGLGDTYGKVFCDPKLPFADCARKWQAARKDGAADAAADSQARTLRSRKRMNYDDDKEGDALSELESLAKVGRSEEPPGAELWFSERALETRLHRVAHAAQTRRHVAIDVETERAKLHALLRDDASSDSSRRSTPAPPPPAPPPAEATPPPPPAHQRAPAHQAGNADSAPLDLSEPPRRDPAPAPSASPAPVPAPAAPPASRLDDTLSKLMKRKNVPTPEPVVGKEKKRKKLDEIVLGLSAAKVRAGSGSTAAAGASASPTPPPAPPAQPQAPKPAPAKEPSFLQQSLEQSAKPPRASPSAPLKPYSHEAKVNKWLAEQARRPSPAPAPSPSAPAAPRLLPDEHVPVVHRVSGKRLQGHKAPQLKHLAHWIAENPLYDIDPKWTEGIKEHVKLPAEARGSRHPAPAPSAAHPPERKKPRASAADAHLAALNPALLASLSGLGGFDPKALAATLSNMSGFDPKLLAAFDPKMLAGMGGFDPKSGSLLSSFGGVPNLLGNLGGGNLFSNLAGLGLPGFPGMDAGGAGASSESKQKSRKPSDMSGSVATSKASNSQFPFVFPNPNMLYPQLGLSGMNPFGMHSGLTSAYDALGLLGNNLSVSSSAATMQSSGHSSSRSGAKTTTPRSSTVTTNSSRHQKVSDRQQPVQIPQIMLPPDPYLLETLTKQSLNYEALLKAEKKVRDSHDLTATDLSKLDRKKFSFDALRSHVPPEFAAVQEKLLKGDKKDIDISKMLLEQMASGALSASLVSSGDMKKVRDCDKDAYDKLSKNSSEYVSHALEDASHAPYAHKRSHDEMMNEPENLVLSSNVNLIKKLKETKTSDGSSKNRKPDPTQTGEMDLEDLIAPSTVIKTGAKHDSNVPKMSLQDSLSSRDDKPIKRHFESHEDAKHIGDNSRFENPISNMECENKDSPMDDNNSVEDLSLNDAARKGLKKKTRKMSEESSTSTPRRELRSSTGRSSSDFTSPNH